MTCRYRVVYSSKCELFERYVNESLAEGWVLQGGVSQGLDGMLAQAMYHAGLKPIPIPPCLIQPLAVPHDYDHG